MVSCMIRKMRSPSSVRRTFLGSRWNSLSASSSSSRAIRWLTALGVRHSSPAAREKLRWRAAIRKVCRLARCAPLSLGPLAKPVFDIATLLSRYPQPMPANYAEGCCRLRPLSR
ncbi:hypothetical protein D3C75_679720 [compost metagenome]